MDLIRNSDNYNNIKNELEKFIKNHIKNSSEGINLWREHLKYRPNILTEKKGINKYLLIDVLNFQNFFLKTGDYCNQSDLRVPKEKISKFMNWCKKNKIIVYIFIDSYRVEHNEAMKKWIVRREKAIYTKRRGVPWGSGMILRDYFEKFGAVVHYSYTSDCDDTIASFASNLRNTIVLTGDRDIYRYKYNNFPTIYSHFEFINDEVIFYKKDPVKRKPWSGVDLLDIITPVPETCPIGCNIETLKRDLFFKVGVPNINCVHFGNFAGSRIKEIRHAMYYHVFNNTTELIREFYPEWDKEDEKVIWIDEKVNPNPKYLKMLKDDPIKLMNIFFNNKFIDKMIKKFYEDYKNSPKNKYNNLQDVLFTNCLFSIYSMIILIHHSLDPNKELYVDILERSFFKKYNCLNCKKEIIIPESKRHLLRYHKKKLLHICKDCKVKQKILSCRKCNKNFQISCSKFYHLDSINKIPKVCYECFSNNLKKNNFSKKNRKNKSEINI